MSSSSNSNLAKQYYYQGQSGFVDTSDVIAFKKRKGILQVVNEPVVPSTSQSLQNRTSYQLAYLGCVTGCNAGGFPRNLRLTRSTP